MTGGSWQLSALFESEKHAIRAARDGGIDPVLYETGTNLTLSPFVNGMVGYWKSIERNEI